MFLSLCHARNWKNSLIITELTASVHALKLLCQEYDEFNLLVKKCSSAEDDLKGDKSETRGEQKDASYIYQEQNLQPVHLSSSIFYGGREIYSHPTDNHDSPSTPTPVSKYHPRSVIKIIIKSPATQ